MTNPKSSIAVVGAGIVGLCCALELQRAGHRVTLIDKGEPGKSTSFGNAGILTATERGPVGMPGLIWQVPKLLSNPLGPMAVKPTHLPKMARWGVSLLSASRRSRVEEIADHMELFFQDAVERYRKLLGSVGVEHLIHQNGYLCVYSSKDVAAGDDYFWDIHRRRGIVLEELGESEIRQMVPEISRNVTHGIFVPQEGRVVNPYGVSEAIFAAFQAEGGRFIQRAVRDIRPRGAGFDVVCEGETVSADKSVLSAGVWSKDIARRLGTRVLMESMRGYHAQLPNPGIDLRLPVLSGDHKFFASPMEMGLRLAGTAEFAGTDTPPNYRRADILVDAAKTLFPTINDAGKSVWMGHRPMTPDSLPVVGPSKQHRGLYFAFGHGHNGLSGAPMTAQLVSEMVSGHAPSIDLAPFAPDRFH